MEKRLNLALQLDTRQVTSSVYYPQTNESSLWISVNFHSQQATPESPPSAGAESAFLTALLLRNRTSVINNKYK